MQTTEMTPEDLSSPQGQARAIRARFLAGEDVAYLADPANYTRRHVPAYTTPDGFRRDAAYVLTLRNPHTGNQTDVVWCETEAQREEYFRARTLALLGLPR